MEKKYSSLAMLTGTLAMLVNGIPTNAASFLQKEQSSPSPSKEIIAQNPSKPDDVLVPNPTIIIEDRQSHHENRGQAELPETQETETLSPPTLPPAAPRAVAPPVGDIAVSNMDASLDRIDLGTDIIVPRIVLKQAPVREVLELLARNAGLSVIFIDTPSGGEGEQGTAVVPTVSLDLENESLEDTFNSVLMVSGLKANRQGNTIFIGTVLPDGARNLVSRTLRLNQAEAETAGLYLASQGAEVQRVVVPINNIRGDNGQITDTQEGAPELQVLTADIPEDSQAALLLKGLKVTLDDRLNSVNLIGEPRKVEIATSFLVQLDARRRQVSVNVKVIDVNLLNIQKFDGSFGFGFEDGFFLQNEGNALLNFNNINQTDNIIDRSSNSNELKFFVELEAQIENGNAKVLTDPVLVVQEGQEARVELVQEIVTSVNTSIDTESGVRTVTPQIQPAGLILGVLVERIDDNGFINLVVNPEVSAPGPEQRFESGRGVFNTITPLNKRKLSSGLIRLRDDQTLILSGIIEDSDRATVRKVPILGDIPLLGALFRKIDNQNERREVIIMLTPKILDEDAGYGSNFRPGPDAREMLQERDFPLPNTEELP